MNPSSTPPSSTPDAVLAGAAEGVEPPDALDALLRQIVGGYFVLTDAQGAVSKWSEPAELLFGRASEEILGQGFFETLVGGTLPPGGQAWRGFLDLGEPPQVPGTVELVGRDLRGRHHRLVGARVEAGGRRRRAVSALGGWVHDSSIGRRTPDPQPFV